jgi:hypothetical protein
LNVLGARLLKAYATDWQAEHLQPPWLCCNQPDFSFSRSEGLRGPRFLIFVYPNKAAADKVWADSIRPWMKGADKYVSSFRTIGVEGIEPK